MRDKEKKHKKDKSKKIDEGKVMKVKVIIKCYRCKKKYIGASEAECVSLYDLKKDAHGYYCNCAKQFIDKIGKPKKEMSGLDEIK